MNARHYDPGMARFLEVDTYTGELNDPLSLNLYTYCHNEPLMYSDPSGHAEKFEYTEDNYTHGIRLYNGVDGYEKDIKVLQTDLKYLGLFSNSITGIFDKDTEDSVNVFKDKWLKNGNLIDSGNRGVVGDTTWAYLKREKALKQTSTLAKTVKAWTGTDWIKNTITKEFKYNLELAGLSAKNIKNMTTSSKGVKEVANFELSESSIKAWGLGQYDNNGILTGIYPHYVFRNIGTEKNPIWVSDGGITFGYGHYVSKSEFEDVKSERAIVDKYAKGAPILPLKTPSAGVPYKVPNSKAMPVSEARKILKDDLDVAGDAVNEFLITHKIYIKQYQFDMLVSFTHNYGAEWWVQTPEKVLPKLIRQGKGYYNPDDVIRIFKMHENEERRIEEAHIFNNGYK